MKSVKRYFSYIGKYKTAYFTILAVTILFSAFMEVLYSYMNKAVFNAVEYRDIDKFKSACILCFISLVLSYFRPYLRYFEMRQVRRIVFDIKLACFEKLNRLNMRYFEEHHSGDALKTLNRDANILKDSYFTSVFRVMVIGCDGFAAVITMIYYSRKLAVISVLFSIVSVVISIKVNKTVKEMSREIQVKLSRLTGRLSDILSGFIIIKMYRADSIIHSFNEETEYVRNDMCRQSRVLSSLEMLTFLAGMLGSFGTILAGSFLVANGEMDYGTIMAVVTLQMSVSMCFQNFGGAITRFTSDIASADRVFDFLELDCEEHNYNAESIEPDIERGISIKNLTFAYDGKENVLDGFNLLVTAGEKIMLVGESGCGKSTLLKLLMRFYERNGGSVEILGHGIDEYGIDALRSLITYVPQENYLFEGTIMENILFGNPKAGYDEAVKAAEMAYADEFISEFPEKYDTIITAGGKNLSGGQRQRVAIARAFLKDSPILLMDEPSSALDVESEKKINLAMRQLMEGRIVIMATHRTTSFSEFDRMVKMK